MRRRASTDTVAPTSTITSPAQRRRRAGEYARHDHRHGHRRRRRHGRRRRGLGRWRRDLAAGRPAAATWTYSLADRERRGRSRSSAAPSTTAATWNSRHGHLRDGGVGTVTCPCSFWTPAQGPAGRRQRRERRSSSARGSVGRRGLHHRRSGSTRRRRTPARTSAVCGRQRHAAVHRDVQRRSRRRAGRRRRLPVPVAITAEHDLRGVLPHQLGLLRRDDGYFATSGVDNGPLHAPRDGTEGGRTASTRTAPASSRTRRMQGENYWVDVVFVTSLGPTRRRPIVIGVTPANGARAPPTNTTVTATFNENVQRTSPGRRSNSHGRQRLVPADGDLLRGDADRHADAERRAGLLDDLHRARQGRRAPASRTRRAIRWPPTTSGRSRPRPRRRRRRTKVPAGRSS